MCAQGKVETKLVEGYAEHGFEILSIQTKLTGNILTVFNVKFYAKLKKKTFNIIIGAILRCSSF